MQANFYVMNNIADHAVRIFQVSQNVALNCRPDVTILVVLGEKTHQTTTALNWLVVNPCQNAHNRE